MFLNCSPSGSSAVPLQGHLLLFQSNSAQSSACGAWPLSSPSPVPINDLPKRRHHPWPTRLCLLMGGRIPSPPPQHSWDQQCHPLNSHPESSWKWREGRKRRKLPSDRLPSLNPSSRHSLSKKAFAAELLYQEE